MSAAPRVFDILRAGRAASSSTRFASRGDDMARAATRGEGFASRTWSRAKSAFRSFRDKVGDRVRWVAGSESGAATPRFALPFGEDVARAAKKLGRGSKAKTGEVSLWYGEHALKRMREGRNVRCAIEDVIRSKPSQVFTQRDGRYVVLGSNGRAHIIAQDGEIITTLDHLTNVGIRRSSGRYMTLSEDQKMEFAKKFRRYLGGRPPWSDYLR